MLNGLCTSSHHPNCLPSTTLFPVVSLRPLRQLQQPLQINTLRPLNRQPQRPIPNQLRQRPQPPTNPKRRRIIKRLVKPIMIKQHPTTTIHIRERIFRLPMLRQHSGGDFAVAFHELEDGVGRRRRT